MDGMDEQEENLGNGLALIHQELSHAVIPHDPNVSWNLNHP